MCLETGGDGKGQFFVPSSWCLPLPPCCDLLCMGGLNEENKIDKEVNLTVHKDNEPRCSQSYILGITEQNNVQLLELLPCVYIMYVQTSSNPC